MTISNLSVSFSDTQTEGSAPSSGTLVLEFTLTSHPYGTWLWFEAKTAANVASGENSTTNREDLWTTTSGSTNINDGTTGVGWTVPGGIIADHTGVVYTYANSGTLASVLLIGPSVNPVADGTHIITIDLTAPVMNAWANSGTIKFRGHNYSSEAKSNWADVTINALGSGSVCFLGQTKVTTDQGNIMFNKF